MQTIVNAFSRTLTPPDLVASRKRGEDLLAACRPLPASTPQLKPGQLCHGGHHRQGLSAHSEGLLQGLLQLGQLCAAGWPTLPAHAAHLPWHPLAVVGKRPCLVIFVSLLLTILGAVRLLLIGAMGPLPSVVEQDQLWVPQKAQAITDKNKYEAAFTTTYRRNTLYFTTKPPGGNILTSDFLKEVYRFDHMVTNDLNAVSYTHLTLPTILLV